MTDETDPPADRTTDAERLLEAGLSQAGDTRRQPPASPAELADQFPAFEVLEILGQGGMGVVYKARQRKLDRLVALKVLPRELSEDPAFAERFAREGRTLARLQHPHIVGVHDIGEADGQYYLVMEYVDGVDLRVLMNSGELTAKEALSIVPQICNALQYAHDEGVVHRDIKPENVLLDRAGSVKVADFGLAKLIERAPGDFTLTGTDQVMGTLHYMAPEQYKTPKDVDHRADIFSLGVVFYEMLTGDLPLGRFDKPSETTDLDARIDEIVMRTLERERDQRYQKAGEVGRAVTTFAAAGTEAAPPETEAPPLRRAASHAGEAARALRDATEDSAGRRWSRWAAAAAFAVPITASLSLLAYMFVDAVGSPEQGRHYRGIVGWFTALSGSGIVLLLAIMGIVMTGVYRTRVRGRGLAIAVLALSIAGITASASGLNQEVKSMQWWAKHKGEVWRDAAGRPLLPGPPSMRGHDVTVTGVPDDLERVRVRKQVEETWDRYAGLVAVRDPTVNDLAHAGLLYSQEDMNRLQTMASESGSGFAGKREANELGLGFVGKHSMSTSPSRFRITRIAMGAWGRTASVTASTRASIASGGVRTLIFPMKLTRDGWRLAIGPVQIR